jgi:rhodanese-related sulfurtransferase
MNNFFLYVALLLCAVFCSCKSQNDDFITVVSPEELSVVLKEQTDIKIIDVRTPKEYKCGHIPGAENVNFFEENFSKRVGELDPKKPLIIYCKSGRRSKKSRAVFKELGFLNVYDLQGGILNWKSKGFSLE